MGGYGSNSDSGLLNSTNFFKQLNSRNVNIPPSKMLLYDPNGEGIPHFFIGDEAFPLYRDLLWPFPRNQLSNEAKIYNYRLCRERRVIENAFGILVQRWCIFHYQIYLGPDMAEVVVKATVVLHNILTHSLLHMHLWWSTHCVWDMHRCVQYHCKQDTHTTIYRLGSCKQEYRVCWWSCQCQNLFLFVFRAFPAWYSGRIETKKAHFDQF